MYKKLKDVLESKTFEQRNNPAKTITKIWFLFMSHLYCPNPYGGYAMLDMDKLVQDGWLELNHPKTGERLVKRLKRYAKDVIRKDDSLTEEQKADNLLQINNMKWDVLGEEITRILQQPVVNLSLSSNLNHIPGQFSDKGSCFWGSYENARLWMIEIGAKKLIIETEDGIKGRAWVINAHDVEFNNAIREQINRNNSWIVLNVYHPKVNLRHLEDFINSTDTLSAKIIRGVGEDYYVNDDEVLFVTLKEYGDITPEWVEINANSLEYYEDEEEPEEPQELQRCDYCGSYSANITELYDGMLVCDNCVCQACYQETNFEHEPNSVQVYTFDKNSNRQGYIFNWDDRRFGNHRPQRCEMTEINDSDWVRITQNDRYHPKHYTLILQNDSSYIYEIERNTTVKMFQISTSGKFYDLFRQYMEKLSVADNYETSREALRFRRKLEQLLIQDYLQ